MHSHQSEHGSAELFPSKKKKIGKSESSEHHRATAKANLLVWSHFPLARLAREKCSERLQLPNSSNTTHIRSHHYGTHYATTTKADTHIMAEPHWNDRPTTDTQTIRRNKHLTCE